MNGHFLLKATLSVALCIPPWGGVFEMLTPQAKAQDYLVQNGSQTLSFGAANGQVPLSNLPWYTVNDPNHSGPNYYHGQAPHYSQNVQFDGNGSLLFFVIDGAIYDSEGYLIADNRFTTYGNGQYPDPCVECLLEGVTQVAITAVPGSCSKYYVVAGTTGYDSDNPMWTDLGYSVLDMAMDNTRFSDSRTGHVLNEDELLSENIWSSEMTGNMYFFEGNRTSRLNDLFDYEEEGMQLAVHEPTAVGVPKRLFMVDESFVYIYDMLGNGIHEVGHYTGAGHNSGPYMANHTDCHFGSGIDRPFAGCITTGENAAHEVLLAFTRSHLDDDWTDVDPTFTTYYCKVSTGGQLQFIHNIETIAAAPPGLDFNVPSLAFSPNGGYLYYTQSAVPSLAVVELSGAYNRTDLAAGLSITSPGQLGYGNLYLDKSPTTNAPVLYLIAPQRRGYLTNVDTPGNLTWTEGIPATGAINNAPTSIWASEQGDSYALPEVHNRNERQIQNWQQADQDQTCCLPHAAMVSSNVASISGINPSWTATNNPFGNAAEVTFMNDLVIEVGASINVTGMTWRFGPNAKLIVRAGGYAKFSSSVLTGLACQGYRWPGVQVEGNTAALQTNANQGKVWLYNSTISNAITGVKCASGSLTGYGGIVWASNSTFRNCRTGADLGNYHHSPNSLNIDDNVSFFSNTHFETVYPMPDQLVPLRHLYIHGTRKVNVAACSFANDAPNFYPVEQWGTGIVVDNAEITVQGNSNPASSYVRNLRTGIDRSNCIKLPITVDNMHFSGNVKGIWDHACYFGRYTNNTFAVPDQSTAPSNRMGMHLFQSRYFTVERNSFTGGSQRDRSLGIFFQGILPVPNGVWNYSAEQIYDNNFTDLHAGALVNNVHVSHDGFKDTEGLQILCGDYTDNVMDIALGPTSLIRSDQGDGGGPNPQLAGNRFYQNNLTINCTGVHDWDMDDNWNNLDPFTSLVIDYHRHNVALCDVTCDAQQGSNPDLWDDYVGMATTFDKAGDCGRGVLDNSHILGDVHADYVLARDEAVAAKNLLDGNTDGGEKPDLLADIAQDDPWLGSSTLRDELMLNSPLSDEVLDSMITRGQTMDQWHLTQVLVQNSPLNPGVYSLLKGSGVLSTFFMNVVLDAQGGQGMSSKQLLEAELMQRRNEQSAALGLLGWMWASDTVATGGSDSLRAIFFNDGGLDFTQERIRCLLEEQNFTGVLAELAPYRPNYSGYAEMQALVVMGQAHGGDWHLLTQAEVDSLTAWAWRCPQGAGMIGGLLASNGFPEVNIRPIFPNARRAVQTTEREMPTEAKDLLGITAYPDPADDHAMITFPADYQGSSLVLVDASGRVVLTEQLSKPGLLELDTHQFTPGVYEAFIQGTHVRGRLLVKH